MSSLVFSARLSSFSSAYIKKLSHQTMVGRNFSFPMDTANFSRVAQNIHTLPLRNAGFLSGHSKVYGEFYDVIRAAAAVLIILK